MIGPLTSAVLWLGGFWLEIFLWSLLSTLLYSWLVQYTVTRYLIAYPGVLLLWNLGGWLFCFCIWFIYMLFGNVYDSFIASTDPNTPYMERLGTAMLLSTIVISFFAIRFIYREETQYWENNRLRKQN